MSVYHIVFAGWLIAFPVAFLPSPVAGQTPGADTAPAYSPYGQAEPRDRADSASTADTLAARPGRDTVFAGDSLSRADSVSARDTARSADSLRPGAPVPPTGADSGRTSPDSMRSPGARDSAAPSKPVDSVLSAACGGPDASWTIARDLLVVVFAEDAGAAEREAAARSVKGKLIGQAESGTYYVRIPSGGGEAGLRMAADQLSLLPQVRQVGARACPPSSRDTSP